MRIRGLVRKVGEQGAMSVGICAGTEVVGRGWAGCKKWK